MYIIISYKYVTALLLDMIYEEEENVGDPINCIVMPFLTLKKFCQILNGQNSSTYEENLLKIIKINMTAFLRFVKYIQYFDFPITQIILLLLTVIHIIDKIKETSTFLQININKC